MPFGDVDFEALLQMAEEQSVVGVVAAGLEHVTDVKVPQKHVLQFVGQALQIEQRNKAMNQYIALLINKLRQVEIYSLLMKGQGIAQCYERPLWRSSGDVDLFLSDTNYEKAIAILSPLASNVEKENSYERHLAMTIDSWIVELHGNLRCGLSSRIDAELDEIKKDTFYGGSVRSWMNDRSMFFLLKEDNDAIYVFTHMLGHFYKGGIGLRQICDWCRLLWTYKDSLNRGLLESRIRRMGIMSEWKAFGTLAVKYLGMPEEAMPVLTFRNESLEFSDRLQDKEIRKYKRKADRIMEFVMEVGNFGHNRDTSYYSKYPFLLRKAISFGHRCGDLLRHARIFPLDSFRFFPYIMLNGLREALRGRQT